MPKFPERLKSSSFSKVMFLFCPKIRLSQTSEVVIPSKIELFYKPLLFEE